MPMGENTGAGLKNGMPSNPAAASPYTPSAPTGTEHKHSQSAGSHCTYRDRTPTHRHTVQMQVGITHTVNERQILDS